MTDSQAFVKRLPNDIGGLPLGIGAGLVAAAPFAWLYFPALGRQGVRHEQVR